VEQPDPLSQLRIGYILLMNSEKSELDGLRALDEQALISIHNQYYPEVYRYAQYRLGDLSYAEDVASEVFVRLIEALKSGKGPRSTVRGWLMGTAANLINDHYRRSYAHSDESLTEEIPTDAGNPAQFREQEERAEVVRKALAKLTPEQQHVLTLRFGNEYSLEETALIMGKNTNAIKALQFRAISSLRRLITEFIEIK
jgi:RNA polymerase sigma-70 factor (ECF subfamily)